MVKGTSGTSVRAPQAGAYVEDGLSSRALSKTNEVAAAAGAGSAGPSLGASLGARTGDDNAVLSGAAGLAAEGSDGGVRTAKVAALQQAIAAGTYSVPSSAVADKLVEHLLG